MSTISSSLDKFLDIAPGPELNLDEYQYTFNPNDVVLTPAHRQFGNQNAKGNVIDREIVERLAEHRRQCQWYNNGTEHRFCVECPEGFVPGRVGGWTKNNAGANNPRAASWRLTFEDKSVMIISGLKAWVKQQPDYVFGTLYDAYKRGVPYKNILEITKL